MKQFLLIAFSLMLSLSLSAQKEITVKEGSHSFSTGNHDALYTVVYGASPDVVIKAWKKKMKDFKSKKVSVKKNEIFADNVLIKDLGDNNTVDIYAQVDKGENNSSIIYITVDLGGAYMSSSEHPEKYKFFVKMLKEFSKDVAKEIILAKVKEAEKELKKLKNQQENLVSEKKNLENEIERCKKRIKKAEENIEENQKAQEEQLKKIADQEKVVEKIKAELDKIK